MAKDDEKEGKDDEKKKGGKGKLILMVVPLVLLIAAAGWFFFLRPKSSDAGPVTLPAPVPGVPITIDPITINLAGAHFLKLGMALQPIAGLKEAPDGSKALDLAISQFSNVALSELASTEGRDQAKEDLIARVKLAYLPEGTDLTTAFDASAPSPGATPADAKSSDSKAADVDVKSLTEEKLDALTDEQAVALANKLSVQTDIYDIYFTTFVMQ